MPEQRCSWSLVITRQERLKRSSINMPVPMKIMDSIRPLYLSTSCSTETTNSSHVLKPREWFLGSTYSRLSSLILLEFPQLDRLSQTRYSEYLPTNIQPFHSFLSMLIQRYSG